MNLVFVAPEKEIGGSALSVIGIIEQLQGKNRIIVIIKNKDCKFAQELRKRGIKTIYCRNFAWKLEKKQKGVLWECRKCIQQIFCICNLIQAKRLQKTLRDEDVDLIYTNNSTTNFGAILAKTMHKPHVWHIREFGIQDFNLHTVFSAGYTFKYMNRYSDKVIVISKKLFSLYQNRIDDTKLAMIYNGVDEKIFYKREKKILNGTKINIVMVGRLVEGKGQDILIKAVSLLPEHIKKRVQVQFLGTGDKDYFSHLKALVDEKNLSNIIRFVGYTSDVVSFLEKADICVVNSRAEAFGRVTVEALMTGVLLIATDTGGTSEILCNGKYGILYPYGEEEELKNKIVYAIQNAEDMQRKAMLGREYAVNKFTVGINANEIAEIFCEVMTKNRINALSI